MFVVVSLAVVLTGLFVAASAFSDRSALERAVVAMFVACALPIGLVEALSLGGFIGRVGLIVGALSTAGIVLALTGRRGASVLAADLARLRTVALGAARDPVALVSAVVVLAVVVLALLATWALVPWSWDGLGYHLPVSDDAIQMGYLRTVPTSVVYVNAYPHLGAIFFTAWRLALGDDTWLEAAQLPFALLAVLALALVARREGVSTRRALALCGLFVALPAVALQLAANYVDVVYAAWVLTAFALATGPLDVRTLALVGLALGFVLGTKPSAPPIVIVGLAVLAFAAWRRGGRALLVRVPLAALLTVAVGGWKYVENLAAHGNPIWPVRMHLGPLELPGITTMQALSSMGLGEPMRSMGWLGRVATSWATPFPDRYVYDMRRGGFGPLFVFVLLPVALVALVAVVRRVIATRRETPEATWRSRLALLATPLALFAVPVAVMSLASPGGYWARYTLAFPAVLLVLYAVLTRTLSDARRRVLDGLLVALAAVGVVQAVPGFTIDGPSLFAIAAMPREEREVVFSLDLQETPWHAARSRVGPGQAFAYDASFWLPGRLFAPHQAGRVVYVEAAQPSPIELVELVEREHVRAIVLGEGPDYGGADAARTRPDRFRFLTRCAPALESPCSLFEVVGDGEAPDTL